MDLPAFAHFVGEVLQVVRPNAIGRPEQLFGG